MTTEWSTSGDGSDASVEIDLGAGQQIAGVESITRSMADGTAITTSYWVTIDAGDRPAPFDAGSPADNRFQAIEASGRLVRFEAADTTGGNSGAVEIRVSHPRDEATAQGSVDGDESGARPSPERDDPAAQIEPRDRLSSASRVR